MRTLYAALTTVLAWLYVYEIADTEPATAQALVIILGGFIVGSLVKAANELKKEDRD